MIPPHLYLPCFQPPPPEPVVPAPTPHDRAIEVVSAVAAERGLSPEDVFRRTHKHKIAHARQEAMRRLHREQRWSLPHVAEFMGRQTGQPFHHTTILYGVRRAEARLAA